MCQAMEAAQGSEGVDVWLGCRRSCWKVPLCAVGRVASVGVLFPGHSGEAGGSPLSVCQIRFALPAQAALCASPDWHVCLADPAHQGEEELLASCICLCLRKLLYANVKVQNLYFPKASTEDCMLLGW